jgi:sensor histidine kinase YesM
MKTANKKLFWVYYHGGMLIFSVVVAMVIKFKQTGNPIVPETIVAAATIFLVSYSSGLLAMYFKKRSEKLTSVDFRKQLIPGIMLFSAAVYLLANISVSLVVFIWYVVKGLDLSFFIENLFRNELPYANTSLMKWLSIFIIAFFYILWRNSSIKEDRLREENLTFKYKTLKSQINPHFLFNSLNTLSELVYEDAKKADNYIHKLSAIYRYIIENEDVNLIRLELELDFLNQYFNLQQVRDEGKVFLNIEVENPEKFEIIPVSLQLLVENAIKHNSGSRTNPLNISITQTNDYLIVANNIQRKSQMISSTKVGLKNLKERVKLIMNKDLEIIESNNEFIVKVPILAV